MKRRTVMQAIGAGIAAAGFPSIAAAKTAPFDFEKRTVRLNDGHDMPIIGLGVFNLVGSILCLVCLFLSLFIPSARDYLHFHV